LALASPAVLYAERLSSAACGGRRPWNIGWNRVIWRLATAQDALWPQSPHLPQACGDRRLTLACHLFCLNYGRMLPRT